MNSEVGRTTYHCDDCGIEYGEYGTQMVHLWLPDQEWKVICPGGGMLCPNCICARAKKIGATAVLGWLNIDYAKDYKPPSPDV